MASNMIWAQYHALKGMIANEQADFYGDAEDWQPAYMGISPDLDEVIISDDITEIPVGWFIEQACQDADEIAKMYFDFR